MGKAGMKERIRAQWVYWSTGLEYIGAGQNGGGGGDYIDCILLLFLHHCDILTFLLKNTKF